VAGAAFDADAVGTVQFEAQLAEGTKVLQRLNVATEVQRRQKVLVTTAKLAARGRGDGGHDQV